MKKIIYVVIVLLVSACQKDFLDTKPNKALLVPTKLSDMQALLDNLNVFNITPGITGIADGDFYTTDAAFKAWSIDAERNSYTWNEGIWGTATTGDWDRPWQQVFYANVVLDGLKNIPNSGDYNAIKGTALFSRAFAYYHLLQEFGSSDLGMPIRLSSDVNQKPARASLSETYAQITSDLLAARNLVPAVTIAKNRPNTAAVFALLAKTSLVTANYAQSGKYADSCLQLNGKLIDYNTLSTTAARPFPRAIPSGNDEVIYYSSANSFSSALNTATLADTLLFRSYAAGDLRKTILYKASGISGTFKGPAGKIIVHLKSIIMNQSSYEFNRKQLLNMGFGNEIAEPLMIKMDQNLTEFTLDHVRTFGKDEMHSVIHFSKGDDADKDLTFMNRFEATLKQEGKEDLTQTFFVGMQYNYTLQERYNMMDGRMAYREQPVMRPTDSETGRKFVPTGETYLAWRGLDFKNADQHGNFLPKVIQWKEHSNDIGKYPIVGIEENYIKQRLLNQLEKGNRPEVMVMKDGQEVKAILTANVPMLRLEFHDENGQKLDIKKGYKQAVEQTQKNDLTPQEVQRAAIAKANEQKPEEGQAVNNAQTQQQTQNGAAKEAAANEEKQGQGQRRKQGVHV